MGTVVWFLVSFLLVLSVLSPSSVVSDAAYMEVTVVLLACVQEPEEIIRFVCPVTGLVSFHVGAGNQTWSSLQEQ